MTHLNYQVITHEAFPRKLEAAALHTLHGQATESDDPYADQATVEIISCRIGGDLKFDTESAKRGEDYFEFSVSADLDYTYRNIQDGETEGSGEKSVSLVGYVQIKLPGYDETDFSLDDIVEATKVTVPKKDLNY